MRRARDDHAAGVLAQRFGPLATRARSLLDGRSLWTAGVAGLAMALPSIDYLAVLALIAGSGAAASAQFGALLVFNVVAFTFVEIPLVSYLVAPERTRRRPDGGARLAAGAAPPRRRRPTGRRRLRASRRRLQRTVGRAQTSNRRNRS